MPLSFLFAVLVAPGLGATSSASVALAAVLPIPAVVTAISPKGHGSAHRPASGHRHRSSTKRRSGPRAFEGPEVDGASSAPGSVGC
jgi:hypothetical protein